LQYERIVKWKNPVNSEILHGQSNSKAHWSKWFAFEIIQKKNYFELSLKPFKIPMDFDWFKLPNLVKLVILFVFQSFNVAFFV
jgi:hypothetical protein